MFCDLTHARVYMSPSTRREWIEMPSTCDLPLYGKSPSTRREWIEITTIRLLLDGVRVSLHTEGVD